MKKKKPHPARAAKIFVFGLSTTAMFGAVSGYALADLHEKQHSVPTTPILPAAVPAQVATAPVAPAVDNQPVTQTAESTNAAPKPSRVKENVAVAPAVDNQPVPQAPVQTAPADTNVVIDVPVPKSAQSGQGQTSGGKQQSSGSY